MKILYANNYQELSVLVKNEIIKEITTCINPNICLATGHSVYTAYEILTAEIINEKIDTKHVSFTKLDEWCNLKKSSKASCEHFLKENILNKIEYANYYSLNANVSDLNAEINRVSELLDNHPLDLCILGLGKNGHLGLNEPSAFLQTDIHLANLDALTTHHSMLKDDVVSSGLTLGMGNIMNAKRILFIVAGKNKELVFADFMTKKITTSLPASFLWLLNDVTMIIQKDLF